jgi:peptidyl-dipeptidase Dcp
MQLTRARLEKIKNEKSPDFYNIIEKLESADRELNRIVSCFFNLNSAETNDQMQELATEIAPMLARFDSEIRMDAHLFSQIKKVFENTDTEGLSSEQKRLLEKTFKGFARNGALLSAEDQQKLKQLDEELSRIKEEYGQNLLRDQNAFSLHIQDPKELTGLPESVLENAKKNAENEQKSGYVLKLDMPTYTAVMTYTDNRHLRKTLFGAWNRRGFQTNANNNENGVSRIAELRRQRASLLGYTSHAAFVLEERMASNPENVLRFLNEIKVKALPAAKSQLEEVKIFAHDQGGITLEKWDLNYWSEKLKKERYAFDDEMLKPYFSAENTLQGAFKTAQKLYGLKFVKHTDIPVYHPDVETYKVYEADGTHTALLYVDLFPRPGKRNGAWMTDFKGQYLENGVDHRPEVSIVCNFSKPTQNLPSLLTFGEVTTLFHEFGHALHGMLAKGQYESMTGTHVRWDFVELPSQVMENWCYEKSCLDLFAYHYKTGAPIPQEYVDRIKKAAAFMEGYQTMRQLNFGFLDMAWHHIGKPQEMSVKEFEVLQTRDTELFPMEPDTCLSTSFSHIFNGGYSAGYYSYKWAEVLDADAFGRFLEEGIFNPDTARQFRTCILEKGDSEAPEELFKCFRGRAPRPEALLKRAALID